MVSEEYQKFLDSNKKCKPISELREIEMKLDVLETGIFPLDMAFGEIGQDGRCGVRARSIVEVSAPSNSGKSNLVASFIKETLDRYGPSSVMGIFSENIDYHIYEDKGINMDDIIIRYAYDPEFDTRNNLAEDLLDEVLTYAKRPEIKLIFIDSLSALQTAAMVFKDGGSSQKDREVSKENVAVLANIFNPWIGRFALLNKVSVLLLTSHFHEPLEISRIPIPQSDQIHTRGGTNKEYLARFRVLVRGNKVTLNKNELHIIEGNRTFDAIKQNWVVFKRKLGRPRSTVSTLCMKTWLHNNEEKVLEYAAALGSRVKEGKGLVINSPLDPPVAKGGAYTYIGDKSFNGTANAVEFLRENPEIYKKLRQQICSRLDYFFAKPGEPDEEDPDA